MPFGMKVICQFTTSVIQSFGSTYSSTSTLRYERARPVGHEERAGRETPDGRGAGISQPQAETKHAHIPN